MSKLEHLIKSFKEMKEQLSKNVNGSYDAAPNGQTSDDMAMSEKEPHKDDPRHEAKEKEIGSKIKEDAQDLLDMHKADKDTHSVFTMDHAHAVLSMPHADAKKHLHEAVDASSAQPHNKAKIKAAINGSKNTKELSMMVSNHMLAAGGGGHKTGELKIIKSEEYAMHKNGQWEIKPKS